MKHNCLIVFYRNPTQGKVKTRLATTVGEEKALAVYLMLAAYTRAAVSACPCDTIVYYSEYVDLEDNWAGVSKELQRGRDLGERMQNAFSETFAKGYRSVCIIGTDCLELETHHINKAFDLLKKNEAVIGPAADGGYYLLGLRQSNTEIFQNKNWSTSSVLGDTVADLQKQKKSYAILPTLQDVDEEKDLPERWRENPSLKK